MRFGRLFFGIIFLVCVFETIRLWGVSPARMAAHFNAQGLPDRFTTKMEFFGAQAETMIIAVGLGLLMQILVLTIPVEWVNMPNRTYWLAPERRAGVIDRLSSFGAMLFGMILLVMLIGFELAVSANMHDPIVFQAAVMLPAIAALFIASIAMLFWLANTFRIPSSAAEET